MAVARPLSNETRATGTPDTLSRVQVLDRVFSILDLLSRQGSPLGLAQVARQLDLNKSTVHRLLRMLEHHHYVERGTRNGEYRLGSKLIELGSRAAAALDLLQCARPFLDELVVQTGETAHLGVLREGEIVSLAYSESPRTLRTPSTVGARAPAHCTAIGKSILAYKAALAVEEFLRRYGLARRTAHTITEPAAIREALVKVRKAGYAVDDEEFEEGLRCVGAPVRNHTGRIVAGISVTGPAIRITKDRIAALGATVVKAAERLSAKLGYWEDPVPGSPPRG